MNVAVIKCMIDAIPDGNANMRGAVEFFVTGEDMMELTPWLNEWNKNKEGMFNGRWLVKPSKKDAGFPFRIIFYSTGM